MSSDIKFYIGVLKSEECQCGKNKKSKMALCYSCWSKLPSHMQRELYNKIKEGFEEAYDEAVAFLND